MSKQLMLGLLIIIYLVCLPASELGILPARATPATIVVPDDYSTVQEAIGNAADGDTISVRAGTYYEHIIVNKTVSLVGENVDTTIVDGNSTGHVVYVISNGVNITGFTVRNSGNAQLPTLDAGICLNGTASCTISGNRASNNGFFAISLLQSDQNTITYNNMSGVGWGGIHLLGSSRNVISGNRIADKHGGINGHVSSNYNNITENTISNCTYGMFWHNSNYNTFSGNTLSTIAEAGIWLQDLVSYNNVVENNFSAVTVAVWLQGPNNGNTLLGNVITGAECGISIENQANSHTIAGNAIANSQFGIHVQNSIYTEILSNTIAHSYGSDWDAGIRLDSAGFTRIHDNEITDNWRGILLYTNSPYVSIYNNTIDDNEFGIRVASGGSSYLNVSDNTVMNNRGYGIGLTGFGGASNYATISRNIILNNSDGIALGQYSNYNTIIHNSLGQNDYGIYVEYSTQNTIWGNSIGNNDQQVYVAAGSINNWDGGYPSGGNYWSGYGGGDLYHGLRQDESGSDGIGDTPYVVDSNNRDNYPRMKPYGEVPDVGILGATLSKTIVGEGYVLKLNLNIVNYGASPVFLNVTIISEPTLFPIQRIELALMSRDSLITPLTYYTAGLAKGNYTIHVLVNQILGDIDLADNYRSEWVFVSIPGDTVAPYRLVDIFDVVGITGVYESEIGDPEYWANSDIDGNGVIDIFDVVACTAHYDESW